jgi:hypothetical protein
MSELSPIDGFDDDIDNSIDHPSPDDLGLLCFDDPNLLEELDRRMIDGSPGIPWPEIRDESL